MIENIHEVSIGIVEQAKNGAASMAQNTQTTELILML